MAAALKFQRLLLWVAALLLIMGTLVAIAVAPATARPGGGNDRSAVIDYWTPQRVAAAQPRDLVIDERGLGYLRADDGALTPYGHTVAATTPRLRAVQTPFARPPGAGGGGGGGGSDTSPPVINNMDPDGTADIGTTQTFSATVTDSGSGVKSVSIVIQYPSGSQDTFPATNTSGKTTWSTTLQGFTPGTWRWHVVAKDNAKKGGNTKTSDQITLKCCGGGGGDPVDPNVVANDHWTFGGAVQTAAGRIYFEMPTNKRKNRWAGYVCSGTVATDGTLGRSIIITAAHCVYDDKDKAFARKVLFIPNQDKTTGSGTDLNCSNDPLGCWVPNAGVVDLDWTTRKFPDNIAWDYAYYVVDDGSNALDAEAGALDIRFAAPIVGNFTHALGYSWSDDPFLMYCGEDMATEGSVNWWLPNCELSGGSSGGPWIQSGDTATAGAGPIISVNSWGYTGSPGMAGPKLSGTSAACVFTAAKTASGDTIENC